MSDYQRITSYLYEYNIDIRGENTGFIRVETKDQQLKISFTLHASKLLSPLQLYFYYYDHGNMIGIPWDRINPSGSHLEYKESFWIDDIFHDSGTLNNMDGILLYHDPQHFYGSQWNEVPIHIHSFHTSPQVEPAKSDIEIQPYPSPDYLSCIKISPENLSDFSFLPIELKDNGFLKVQIQKYGHLFLAEKKQKNVHCIGIPGVFSNQRNYIAHLFGFPEFIPVPHRKQKTGNFGYWVMTIDHSISQTAPE